MPSDKISALSKDLAKLMKDIGEVELENVDLFAETLELKFLPQVIAMAGKQAVAPGLAAGKTLKEFEWEDTKFDIPYQDYKQQIEEVEFKRSNGTSVIVGGEKVPHFFGWENEKNPHTPIVIYDVFDHMRHKAPGKVSGVPSPIKKHYLEVFEDPVEWGKLAVEKFGAEMLSLHFVATDPDAFPGDPVFKPKSPRESAKLFEDMLQAVKVPVSIGCSGAKEHDVEMFKAVAAVSESERLMLSAADKETWERVVPIGMKHDHNVLMWTQLDPNDQKKLNLGALEMGLPRDHLLMDPTCATLGYGLEYSYSIYQRYHLNGLRGDTSLSFPMSAGTTNAWGAREAWMSERKHPEWGPRDLRGPLWETYTAICLSIAGMDIAMMFHPGAATMFRELVKSFRKDLPSLIPLASDWITLEI